MLWYKFKSWLTGKPIVLLHDFDGEVTVRLATRVGPYLKTSRWSYGIERVTLHPNGKVSGCSYVVKWEYLKDE